MSRPDLGDLLRARGLMVIAQVALSIVLLIGAALLMKSLARLDSVKSRIPVCKSADYARLPATRPL